jgi:hypothetical protein
MAEDRRRSPWRADAATNAAGGLRRPRPDRLQHPQHQRGVDRRDRQSADERVSVLREGRAPLELVLDALPLGVEPSFPLCFQQTRGEFATARACLLRVFSPNFSNSKR